MTAVSIYNVLRTVAQVQVAQAMAKVDGAVVSLPQVSPSINKPANAQLPSFPAVQDTVHARTQALALPVQVRARMTQALTDTVDRILTTAQGEKTVSGPPNIPRPNGGLNTRDLNSGPSHRPLAAPPTGGVNADVQRAVNIRSPNIHLPIQTVSPVPVRAITLVSLPTPEVIRSLGLVRTRPDIMPNAVQHPRSGASKLTANPMAQPILAKPTIKSDPMLPVVTRLLAQVAEGEITEIQFVKTLIAQILTGRSRDQASPLLPLPRPGVAGPPLSPNALPSTQTPVSQPSGSQTSALQIQVSHPLPQSLREQVQVTLAPVTTIIARSDPSVAPTLVLTQTVTPAFSAFPHILSELAIPQPVTLQALASLTQVPPQFKDLAGLVAYYAAMLPGWPNLDAQRVKRPTELPLPLIQLAQVVKHLSPEQQIALLSRMGMPFAAIQVLQKMLKDLDKKLNAQTVETFLAAFLGTLSFVVEEVVAFFDDLGKVSSQERTN